MRHLAGLQMGYAVLYSSGTRTNTHYNLQLGETAIMVGTGSSRRTRSGYTIGVGGSGGAIQQYVYGQNHEGLLDGGVPCSYPDAGHADDPRRRLRAARTLARLEGAREHALDVADVGQPLARRGPERVRDDAEPVRGPDAVHAGASSTECINGWQGLAARARSALVLDRPGSGPAGLQPGRLRPG